MSLATKIVMSGVPFLMLANSGNDIEVVGGIAGQVMKYGELGLCFALVAYLLYSNWSLVNSLQQILKEKTTQEERLIKALQTFCAVCRERPCLVGANAFRAENPDGIANKTGNKDEVDG